MNPAAISDQSAPLDFADEELVLQFAGRELAAGVAHRLGSPRDVGSAEDDDVFLGAVIAGTVVRAGLWRLVAELDKIVARASIRRERKRVFGSDPLSGTLDLGRIGLAIPEVDSWPLIRARRTHDHPENAVLAAVLRSTSRWSSTQQARFRKWQGAELFAESAKAAQFERSRLKQALGELWLEELGASPLLPLARERVALKQADPVLYADALAIAEALLAVVDPRRRASLAHGSNWILEAALSGLNENGLQHHVFELWVAASFLRYWESCDYRIEYRAAADGPFAVASKGSDVVEVWWQRHQPIIDWPSPTHHEQLTASGWSPIVLKPDLVFTRTSSTISKILCVECKNKRPERAISKDLAQAFGYIAHYAALPACALVYRDFGGQAEYQRAPTGQRLSVLACPIQNDPVPVGKQLSSLMAAAL